MQAGEVTTERRFLVTGGLGFIGAWTLYHLARQGERAVCFDVGANSGRLDMLLLKDQQASIQFVQGDITSKAQVDAALENITHIIHLGALQVPSCKANPILGSAVNVTGTINLFEAAREKGIQHIAYASSIAVYGRADEYPCDLLPDDAPRIPHTLYGAYKICNEETARVYFEDHGITSTGLRPFTVYGVGRDQGLTSEPTKAMLAAAKGEHYSIPFGGKMQFQWGSDVARQFIQAALQPLDGAFVFNFNTAPVEVAEVAQMIMRIVPEVRIDVGTNKLPFPIGFTGDGIVKYFSEVFETPLEEGIRQTIEHFRTASIV